MLEITGIFQMLYRYRGWTHLVITTSIDSKRTSRHPQLPLDESSISNDTPSKNCMERENHSSGNRNIIWTKAPWIWIPAGSFECVKLSSWETRPKDPDTRSPWLDRGWWGAPQNLQNQVKNPSEKRRCSYSGPCGLPLPPLLGSFNQWDRKLATEHVRSTIKVGRGTWFIAHLKMADQPLPPGRVAAKAAADPTHRRRLRRRVEQLCPILVRFYGKLYDPSKDLLLLIWTASFGDKTALDKYILYTPFWGFCHFLKYWRMSCCFRCWKILLDRKLPCFVWWFTSW